VALHRPPTSHLIGSGLGSRDKAARYTRPMPAARAAISAQSRSLRAIRRPALCECPKRQAIGRLVMSERGTVIVSPPLRDQVYPPRPLGQRPSFLVSSGQRASQLAVSGTAHGALSRKRSRVPPFLKPIAPSGHQICERAF
jgi:hypothetical protein